jgi:NitT/TauT family transport system ATP-binding protein
MSGFRFDRKEVLLDIQDVSVSYGKVPVLKNLSGTIYNITRPGMQQGQILGILGPSGVGKTTLFRVLAGLMQPDAGEVVIGEGGEPTGPGKVGVVAQNYPLLEHRTVWGNLIFAGKQAGMSARVAAEAATTILEEFGLLEHKGKYPIQLSGGQRQRVAIAQQLICNEHFILMDEPFSGLDVLALERVRQMLISVANIHEHNTFIVVTHDVSSAVSICDTIWLMGRDRDGDEIIPGAKIMDVIDLIESDVCWHQDVLERPEAVRLVRDIKHKFHNL